MPDQPLALQPQTCLAAGLRWTLRRAGRAGQGPRLLLIHGTGSSGASWAAVAQCLADHFELLLPDLPGHGGTQGFADRRAGLPRMASALAGLLETLDWAPDLVAGHSAGAAVMLQMALDQRIHPRALLSLNGALEPLPALARHLFPPLARLMAASPWLPELAARRAARPAALQRLIASTGSRLDAEGVERYRGLLSQQGHVRGALDMMANWQLDDLIAALPRLHTPLWLAAGTADGTVPCVQSQRLAQRLAVARYVALPGLGHLAHEEAPAQLCLLINTLANSVGTPR